MKITDGLATSSTPMVRRLRCSTLSPLTPGTPTSALRSGASSISSSTCVALYQSEVAMRKLFEVAGRRYIHISTSSIVPPLIFPRAHILGVEIVATLSTADCVPHANCTCRRTSSTKALRCLASTPSKRSSAEKLRASRTVLAGEWMSNCTIMRISV